MINLIPIEKKKGMYKDFYFRIVIVLFLMLGLSFSVASVAILPSYIISSVERNSIDEKLNIQENEAIPIPDQNTLNAVEDLKNKLSSIENIKENKLVFSQKVINEIIFKKTPIIKIIEISYQNDIQTGENISIRGIAPSREALLLFRRALEDNIAFSKVNLPISNFIKGSNIKFYLSLIPS
ncbi:MAG: hypothetical protein UR25_C0003G0113 [Candidatus Nomurabacteria bacterium GW2011_GWE1_32_28]|uniref:Uncharacterized protein n=1 Tax=Candidatus Nomurabacteria bacterium GW2011_GWF1_31_48 TaxID=1618767 RepID=A0A0G0AUJ1_9BACT|nr:MAG: hypothetical protein UR10_C0003G0113 [Candidatus Nomurabacteria bacterium GW2011_GWF2_30_133]KKP28753.1 MAG: hypothetical protein UR18_C0002G0165 [Candidatus Nomurabacteria bacterium GW2011_GWE2_31_40]KKP30330.1 MAG: hypothetical protein UR19_C0003G0166 [Candidatus Nomurabacteria bacterium GW2011_GWF1_31_48]KKP34857.1 MAG: hypothetical protein UR25_C0003G0113 [Candidatus Nomurabacteria bacterium GW2011_GWE1_32_28]HAS80951.1 hypothetical protein [Candidatus Nomurabacteria bacterium]